MDEKFCINWNDFQMKVSSSFQKMQEEGYFSDVTLVTDDNKSFAVHKIVLSTSSNLFKTILENYPHSNTLLYMHGVDSKMMKLMIDFMYKGQAELGHDQLDKFLNNAQKLQVEGLLPTNYEAVDNSTPTNIIESREVLSNDESDDITKTNGATKRIISNVNTGDDQNEIIRQKVSEMIYSDNGIYTCKVCGKVIKSQPNIYKHVETHIEGVLYECHQCNKTFRSRNSLSNHKSARCK